MRAVWASEIVKHKMGTDPAAVAYDACEAAKARGLRCADRRYRRAAAHAGTSDARADQDPRRGRQADRRRAARVLLVLDATTGQNGIQQARHFAEAIGLTGIVLAKLDGTAKGGVVFAIKEQLNIPVKFIGLGETPQDIETFDPQRFVEALFRRAATRRSLTTRTIRARASATLRRTGSPKRDSVVGAFLRDLCLLRRQSDAHAGPQVGAAIYADAATVKRDDAFDDRQSQADVAGGRGAGTVHSIEAIEDLWKLPGVNAGAVVRHIDVQFAIVAGGSQVDAAAAGGIPDSIGNQISNRPLKQGAIELDLYARRGIIHVQRIPASAAGAS